VGDHPATALIVTLQSPVVPQVPHRLNQYLPTRARATAQPAVPAKTNGEIGMIKKPATRRFS
jgi:hypothetical protein